MKKGNGSKEKFKSFLTKTINDTLKKINAEMKKNGIIYLYENEDVFFDPDHNDICRYQSGDEYCDGQYVKEMELTDLKSILPDYIDDDEHDRRIDTNSFTTQKKLDNFISEGFDKIKRKHRLNYIRDLKSATRKNILRLEEEIHSIQMKIVKDKNNIEKYEDTEKELTEEYE